jgi:hypothetical protein
MSQITTKYLDRLTKKLPSPSTPGPVMHEYGPVDLLDTEQRVQAVEMIYRLMLDRAATILVEGKA